MHTVVKGACARSNSHEGHCKHSRKSHSGGLNACLHLTEAYSGTAVNNYHGLKREVDWVNCMVKPCKVGFCSI